MNSLTHPRDLQQWSEDWSTEERATRKKLRQNKTIYKTQPLIKRVLISNLGRTKQTAAVCPSHSIARRSPTLSESDLVIGFVVRRCIICLLGKYHLPSEKNPVLIWFCWGFSSCSDSLQVSIGSNIRVRPQSEELSFQDCSFHGMRLNL